MGCSHWNKKGRSEIIVYPVTFTTSYIQLLDDFLGILIDHEGYHAREAYEVPTSSMTLLRRLISKKFYIRHYLESEIRARFNELRCIEQNERNFSQPYKEWTMKSFYDDMAMLIELYNPAEIQLELTREPL